MNHRRLLCDIKNFKCLNIDAIAVKSEIFNDPKHFVLRNVSNLHIVQWNIN